MNSPCRQADLALEILARVERIGEVHLDLPLIVDLHGLGLRDREFVQRRNAPALRAGILDAERRAVPAQHDFLFFALAQDVADGEAVLAFAARSR